MGEGGEKKNRMHGIPQKIRVGKSMAFGEKIGEGRHQANGAPHMTNSFSMAPLQFKKIDGNCFFML